MEGKTSVPPSSPGDGKGDDGSIEARIKSALVKSLRLNMDPTVIPSDVPLIGKGLGLDSVSVLQLVGAVEETLGITVDDTDINRDLFQNIQVLADYVRHKLAAS